MTAHQCLKAEDGDRPDHAGDKHRQSRSREPDERRERARALPVREYADAAGDAEKRARRAAARRGRARPRGEPASTRSRPHTAVVRKSTSAPGGASVRRTAATMNGASHTPSYTDRGGEEPVGAVERAAGGRSPRDESQRRRRGNDGSGDRERGGQPVDERRLARRTGPTGRAPGRRPIAGRACASDAPSRCGRDRRRAGKPRPSLSRL